jgi:molybdenum cofactor biosynthesis protein B
MAIDETRAFRPINIAVLTVSDTRTAETDTSGDILAGRVTGAGHNLAARMIVKDDAASLAAQFEAWIDDPLVDAIVSTGGTGLTGRDVTPEALSLIVDGPFGDALAAEYDNLVLRAARLMPGQLPAGW